MTSQLTPFATGCTGDGAKMFECTKCSFFFELHPIVENALAGEHGTLVCAVCPDCVLDLNYDGSFYDGTFMDYPQ